MPTSTTAWTDDLGVLWPTEAEAIAANNKYAADALFQVLLDEERNTFECATIDDLIATRASLEAIFTALDG